MPQRFSPIRFCDFSGGMNSKVVNHLMLDSEVKLARNCILDDIGALTKRKGYRQVGTQITAGTNILGSYYFNSGTSAYSQHLVACGDDADSNVDIYYNNAGVWTKVTGLTDWTPEAKVRFESFLNYVFAFNGTDSPESWTGNSSDSSGTTNLDNAPTCKYGRVYQNRLIFANAGGDEKSRIYYSLDVAGGSISFHDDYLDINPADGDDITGLGENSGRLLIFKNNSMFRWNGRAVEPDPIIDVGTSSQESVKTIHGTTYFFNRYGIYAYDGSMPYLISRKIQNWVDGIDQSKLADVVAEVDTDHYYLSAGTVTIGTDTYGDAWLVYNIPLKAWTIWTMGSHAKSLTHYYSSGTRYISFGDDYGKVFQINSGTNDADAAIPMNIETKQYDLQTPEEEKKYTEVYAITENGKGIVEVGCKIDDYPIETIGYTDADVTKLPSSLQGKKISVVLSESGTGEPWSLQQIVFKDVFLMGVV